MQAISSAGIKEITETPGLLISQATLTLSATSQQIPTPPAGARRVMIQVQGGTVTDSAWLSADGSVATSSDFVLRNAQDVTSNTEIIVGGPLTNINILGTANASTAVFWFFK